MSSNCHNTLKMLSSGLKHSMLSAVLLERLMLLLLPHTSIEPEINKKRTKACHVHTGCTYEQRH